MLEIRDYTITEMRDLLKTREKQGINRKLNRYGVEYTLQGRGEATIYNIKQVPDPFKIYAITKLGITAQSDFTKIRNIYYYFFCAEGFVDSPVIEMERIMKAEGADVSRQTITKWLDYLQHINYITFSADNIKYYIVKKTPDGEKIYEEIEKELYKKGWTIYFKYKEIEGSKNAYSRMYNIVGGHPCKKLKVIENAILQHEIDELIEVINDSILDNSIE